MAETVQVIFEGNESDYIAAAKKVDAETKRFSETLKKAGVSQSAYNKVVQQSQAALRAQADAAKKAAAATTAGAGGGAMKFTELSSAIGLAGQALQVLKTGFNFAKEGAQLEFTRSKFENLSESIGTTSDKLLGELRTATHGMYSDMQLIGSATDFVGLGLANTSDEAVRLATVSAGLNMNMNQLVLTLTNMTTMRFDALGVRVDGFKDKVKALEEQGYSTDAAFKEAFLQQAEAQLQLVGSASDTTAGQIMRMEAAWANWLDVLKGGAATLVGGALDYADLTERSREYADAIKEETGKTISLDQARAHMKTVIEAEAEAQDNARHAMQKGIDTAAWWAMRMDEGASATDGMTTALDGMTGSLEEVSAKNDKLIKDAIQIQDQQDKYKESQDEILVKITELEDEKAKMRKGDKKGLEEVNGKIDEQKNKYAEAAAAFVEAQKTKFAMMAIEAIALQDGVAGFTQAEADKALAILDVANIAEAAALREAIAFDIARQAIEKGRLSLEDMKKVLERMAQGYTIEVAMIISSVTGALNAGPMIEVPPTEINTGGPPVPTAHGGQFTIPSSYGYEGFNMGGAVTASAGETVTVTTAAQTQAAQQASGGMSIDYKKLALVLRDTLAQAG